MDAKMEYFDDKPLNSKFSSKKGSFPIVHRSVDISPPQN